MLRFVRVLHADLKGMTAMEYGPLAATTVVVGMAEMASIGSNLETISIRIKNILSART